MQALEELLARTEVGSPTVHRNLAAFPLRSPGLADPGYMTLDEALQGGRARVTEVSAGGSVPELRFVNDCDVSIFLMDGEEVVGAKQNRILNVSILAPAGKSITIPVTCVEAGRWSDVSPDFATVSHAHYARGRARKTADVNFAMAASGVRRSDQGAAWADISEKAGRLAAHSPTSAMREMFDRHAASIEGYVVAVTPAEGQTGVLFAIGGALVGFDLFDSPATLSKLLPKLVRSYALDAIDSPMQPSDVPSCDAALALLREAGSVEARSYPALGEGEDLRLQGEHLVGGALLARDRVVHLSAFATVRDSHSVGATAAMRSASQRRQAHLP